MTNRERDDWTLDNEGSSREAEDTHKERMARRKRLKDVRDEVERKLKPWKDVR